MSERTLERSFIENNSLISSVLRELHALRVSQGKEWSARSYLKAAELIERSPNQISSGKDARKLRGIGPKISTYIDTILTNKTIPELAEVKQITSTRPFGKLPNQSRHEVIQLFSTIDRVGPVTAGKWYDQGYRTIEELIAAGQEKLKCTKGQWFGISLYPELSQRIPRAEITSISEKLRKYLDQEVEPLHFEIAGSYRRGRPDSGDIDILVLNKLPGTQAMDRILACPIFMHTLAKGKKKYLGIGRLNKDSLYRRIDVEVVAPEQYPFAICYFTGSANFNVQLRGRAEEHGYRLNEKGIYDAKTLEPATDPATGAPVQIKTEPELLAFLHLPWFEPVEREDANLSQRPW